VSSFSEDSDFDFEAAEAAAVEKAKNAESAALAQAIMAATLAMAKPQPVEVLTAGSIPPIHAEERAARNIYLPKGGHSVLLDRPASAETIGSGGAQSKTSTFKVPYSDHVILEDTGDSSPLQGRVESTIAERSGRKVLTGTSKSISEKTASPKVSI
jgi:hypothetical protein